jgi:hypothetical protein
MINWQFFLKSKNIPNHLINVFAVFEENEELISSDFFKFNSYEILENILGY